MMARDRADAVIFTRCDKHSSVVCAWRGDPFRERKFTAISQRTWTTR